MPSGYVRVKGPDTVVLQVGFISAGVWSSPVFMPGPVTSFVVNKADGEDTIVFAANRSADDANVEVKVQLNDGDTVVADTFVKVPGYGSAQIPLSQFF